MSPDDRHAFVLLGTNEPPDLYPYLVACHRDDDGWTDGNSGNGNMWVPTSEAADLGGLAVFGETVDGFWMRAEWDVPASALTAASRAAR